MKRLVPMKAVIGTKDDLNRPGFIYEPKLDGIRAVCYVTSKLTFYSRNGIVLTKEYPEFQFRDQIKARSAVLDGEIVALDRSLVPRFSLWQQGKEASYIVFDILNYNGKDLTGMPLSARKKILEQVVTPGPFLERCLYTTDGPALYKEILKRHMEGVMAKDFQGLYYPGRRSPVWRKIKRYKTLEAIIIGYTTKQRAVSSLMVGLYDKQGILIYRGKVGTGFTQETVTQLHHLFKKYVQDHPSKLVEGLPRTNKKTITWLKPLLVCEIKYVEVTPKGFLRSPVFIRMRPDKNPQEITCQDQGIFK
jgi:DNA ligase D-like protein (predicted ligase)